MLESRAPMLDGSETKDAKRAVETDGAILKHEDP